MAPNLIPHQASLDSRLRTRIYIYLFISIALVIFSIYEVIIGDIDWWIAALAIIVGIAIGYVYGRTRKVEWNETGEKMVSRIDALGWIAIAVYVVFAYGRDWLFSHWFGGAELIPVSLTFAAGLLLGRFWATRISIMRAFKAKPQNSPPL